MGDKAEKNDLQAHLRADPKSAHGIYDMIKSAAKFRAYASAAQNNITYNSWTKIVFGTEQFDSHATFGSSRFTAAAAGYYWIGAQVKLSTIVDDKEFYVAIYKNGAAARSASFHSSTGNTYMSLQISDLFTLAAGDYLEVYVYIASGASTSDVVTGSGNTYFSGHRLSM